MIIVMSLLLLSTFLLSHPINYNVIFEHLLLIELLSIAECVIIENYCNADIAAILT
jgi:hypothetical protein